MTDRRANDDFVDAIAALGTTRSYPKNTVLVQEGDRSDQIYLVLSGRLKVFLADDEGKEIIVDVLGPRQYFGEMALDGEPRSASVMSTVVSKLVVIQREEFRQFLAAHPDAAFQFILSLIGRARHLTRAVSDLALLDVYGRVAHFLLENAVDDGGRRIVPNVASQQEIAKRVNASRETVSRILTDLRDGGYIAMENNTIEIRQRLPKRW